MTARRPHDLEGSDFLQITNDDDLTGLVALNMICEGYVE